MARFQITCLPRDCKISGCGTDYVYMGSQRVSVPEIARQIEIGEHQFWYALNGEGVLVEVDRQEGTGRPILTVRESKA